MYVTGSSGNINQPAAPGKKISSSKQNLVDTLWDEQVSMMRTASSRLRDLGSLISSSKANKVAAEELRLIETHSSSIKNPSSLNSKIVAAVLPKVTDNDTLNGFWTASSLWFPKNDKVNQLLSARVAELDDKKA